MKDLLRLVKNLLRTIVSGVGAFFLLLYLPLLVVMCLTVACLYRYVVTAAILLCCLADDGNLSNFVFPRWSNICRWIPQLKF